MTLEADVETVYRRLKIVVPIVLTCVALDQISKAIAQAVLPPQRVELLGGLVRLQLSENVGAFLGLGASLPPQPRFWIFTVASGILLAGVIVYAVTSRHLSRDVVIALAFVTGGGISNLIDRALRDGRVVDFLNFGIGGLRTGILNLADIFITFGALYVLWVGLVEMRQAPLSDETGEPERR